MLGNSAPADTLDSVRYTLHAASVTHIRLFLSEKNSMQMGGQRGGAVVLDNYCVRLMPLRGEQIEEKNIVTRRCSIFAVGGFDSRVESEKGGDTDVWLKM